MSGQDERSQLVGQGVMAFAKWRGEGKVVTDELCRAYQRYCDALLHLGRYGGCGFPWGGVDEQGRIQCGLAEVGKADGVGGTECVCECGGIGRRSAKVDLAGRGCVRGFGIGVLLSCSCCGRCLGSVEGEKVRTVLGGNDGLVRVGWDDTKPMVNSGGGGLDRGKFCADTQGGDVSGTRDAGLYESRDKLECGNGGKLQDGGVEQCGVARSDGGSDVSGTSASVSAKTLLNRQKRANDKVRKLRKQGRQTGVDCADWRSKQEPKVLSELQLSLEAKWKAQNAVAEARAKRELELLQSQDVGTLKELQRTKVLRGTENNLVAVEKAYSMLKQTGNVPGCVPGSCETVISGGSISPSSSASNAGLMAMKKQVEDLSAEVARLKGSCRIGALKRLADGETVAFTADNVSEGLMEDIQDVCMGAMSQQMYPGDEETLYIKAMDATLSWEQVVARRKEVKQEYGNENY